MIKKILFVLEDILWFIRCEYNLWLHGPYGLSKVIEKIPYRFLIKNLRRYGATIGNYCRFERGINLHRPLGKEPFENLIIGNNVYLGHNTLLDLSRKIIIEDNVIIASRCQIWTHTSIYESLDGGDNFEYKEKYGDVIIKKNSVIYSGVIIKHGIVIGECSKIGAGSVVIRNIAPYTFAAGNPAREIKEI